MKFAAGSTIETCLETVCKDVTEYVRVKARGHKLYGRHGGAVEDMAQEAALLVCEFWATHGGVRRLSLWRLMAWQGACVYLTKALAPVKIPGGNHQKEQRAWSEEHANAREFAISRGSRFLVEGEEVGSDRANPEQVLLLREWMANKLPKANKRTRAILGVE